MSRTRAILVATPYWCAMAQATMLTSSTSATAITIAASRTPAASSARGDEPSASMVRIRSVSSTRRTTSGWRSMTTISCASWDSRSAMW